MKITSRIKSELIDLTAALQDATRGDYTSGRALIQLGDLSPEQVKYGLVERLKNAYTIGMGRRIPAHVLNMAQRVLTDALKADQPKKVAADPAKPTETQMAEILTKAQSMLPGLQGKWVGNMLSIGVESASVNIDYKLHTADQIDARSVIRVNERAYAPSEAKEVASAVLSLAAIVSMVADFKRQNP